MTKPERAPKGVDLSKPSVARMYDYYLGGKNNYAVDRDTAARILEIAPFVPAIARQNRGFLGRAVRSLAASGIRQFIDIGAGLPTQGNVHEIVRGAVPDGRVVYVDNDPLVVAHGHALLAKHTTTTVIEGDLRGPGELLAHPRLRALIDFDRPVGLLLVAVLHCLTPEERPHEVVAELRDALPPGSQVVISHLTGDDEVTTNSTTVYRRTSSGLTSRSEAEITAFFDGFTLLDPGVVQLNRWRPDHATPTGPQAGDAYGLCGVGRKNDA